MRLYDIFKTDVFDGFLFLPKMGILILAVQLFVISEGMSLFRKDNDYYYIS